MEQLSYGAFSADLHQRQAGERVPLQVSIEVTRRCPLECLHCYNNLPMGDMEAKQRELSKEEHFRMLDELVEMGCFWLHGRRDFCAQRLSRDLHLRQEKRISDHAVRAHAGNVRGADGDSGVV